MSTAAATHLAQTLNTVARGVVDTADAASILADGSRPTSGEMLVVLTTVHSIIGNCQTRAGAEIWDDGRPFDDERLRVLLALADWCANLPPVPARRAALS